MIGLDPVEAAEGMCGLTDIMILRYAHALEIFNSNGECTAKGVSVIGPTVEGVYAVDPVRNTCF